VVYDDSAFKARAALVCHLACVVHDDDAFPFGGQLIKDAPHLGLSLIARQYAHTPILVIVAVAAESRGKVGNVVSPSVPCGITPVLDVDHDGPR